MAKIINGQTVLDAHESEILRQNLLHPNFENLNFIRRAIRTLREKCLEGLQVNGIEDIMSLETGILAMLQPKLGYKTCREIVDYAGKENKTIISVLLEHEYVTKEELEKLINKN